MSEDLAELIAFSRRREHDPELTYKQLGAELNVPRRFLIDRLGREAVATRLRGHEPGRSLRQTLVPQW
jgi:hypothetical protein